VEVIISSLNVINLQTSFLKATLAPSISRVNDPGPFGAAQHIDAPRHAPAVHAESEGAIKAVAGTTTGVNFDSELPHVIVTCCSAETARAAACEKQQYDFANRRSRRTFRENDKCGDKRPADGRARQDTTAVVAPELSKGATDNLT